MWWLQVEINRLDLLAGEPIKFLDLDIHSPSLRDIRSITHERFNRLTGILTLTETDLIAFYEQSKLPKGETNPLRYIVETASHPQGLVFFLELQMAFFTYIKNEVVIDKENKQLLVWLPEKDVNGKLTGERIKVVLDQTTFPQFQEVINAVSFTINEEEEPLPDFGPGNERLTNKFKEARARLNAAKARERQEAMERGDLMTFPDIVSSLCGFGTGYTLFNVWDLTIYQLYDQFKRNQAKEDYESSVQMLLAGADKKKVELRYWMKDITKQGGTQ